MTWLNFSRREYQGRSVAPRTWRVVATVAVLVAAASTTTGCVVPIPVGSSPAPPETTTVVPGPVTEEPGYSSESPSESAPEPTSQSTPDDDSVTGSVAVDRLFNECVPDALSASNVTAALRPCASGQGLNDMTRIIEEYKEDELDTVYTGKIHKRTVRFESPNSPGEEPTFDLVVCVMTADGLAEHSYTVAGMGTSQETIVGVPEDPMWGCSD